MNQIDLSDKKQQTRNQFFVYRSKILLYCKIASITKKFNFQTNFKAICAFWKDITQEATL